MEKEFQQLLNPDFEEKHYEDIKAYWDEIMSRTDDDDFDGVVRLLQQRGDFSNNKLPGEDEIMTWGEDAAVRLKKVWPFELNEKGIIVSIKK